MRRIVFLAVGVLVWASTAAPALAAHTHAMRTGSGSCVILAANGGEKDVQLPHAGGPENRRHPLHVNVHLGEPGTRHGDDPVENAVIWVYQSAADPCTEYVND